MSATHFEYPPLDRWIKANALREVARLAADLPDLREDEIARRMARLTREQRRFAEFALDRVLWENRRSS